MMGGRAFRSAANEHYQVYLGAIGKIGIPIYNASQLFVMLRRASRPMS